MIKTVRGGDLISLEPIREKRRRRGPDYEVVLTLHGERTVIGVLGHEGGREYIWLWDGKLQVEFTTYRERVAFIAGLNAHAFHALVLAATP